MITRHGKPVARIIPAAAQRGEVQWGAMRDRIKFLPGWDDPIDVELVRKLAELNVCFLAIASLHYKKYVPGAPTICRPVRILPPGLR